METLLILRLVLYCPSSVLLRRSSSRRNPFYSLINIKGGIRIDKLAVFKVTNNVFRIPRSIARFRRRASPLHVEISPVIDICYCRDRIRNRIKHDCFHYILELGVVKRILCARWWFRWW